MSAPVSDRLAAAWLALCNAFMGRKAVKQVDACARYWGTVSKASGAAFDVMLDSADIASPSGLALQLGLPGCTVSGIVGLRVLVGFRDGDLTKPFAETFEQGIGTPTITIGTGTAHAAARETDATGSGSVTAVVAQAGPTVTVTFAFVPQGGGAPVPWFAFSATGAGTPGTYTMNLPGKIMAGSAHVSIGG